jgi:hypothetical protein
MNLSIRQLLGIASLLTFSALAYGQKVPTTISAQFEYELKITADPAKRAAYLKQSGEAPSPYEQVLNLVKGSMQVATVVEKVDIKKDQYHINSTGTLLPVLSTVLQGQKLIRDSVGSIGPGGMLTNTYQEKRGNTELLIAKVDAPKSLMNFYKVSSRTPPTGTAPYAGQLLDMVTVGYQFIDRPLPTKPVTYQVSDARSVNRYTLVPAEVWEFPIDGKKVRAQRFYKTTSKDDTATFEIWFSEGRNLPLRSVIGLSEQYGATIRVDLKKIPAF